jgi:GxxExxY protein
MDLLEHQEPLIYKTESYKIIGACMEVHKVLGNGFLEAVYQEALAIEFERREIPYEEEKTLRIMYKNHLLKKTYDADFICYDKIIVEIKAISELHSSNFSQTLNYLKATGFKLGILVNFGAPSLEYRRVVL